MKQDSSNLNEPKPYNLPHKPHHFATKKVAVLIILFLIVSLTSLLGVLYVVNVEKGSSLPPTNTARISPSATQQPSPSSDFVVYSSPDYGYSISYPQQATIRETSPTDLQGSDYLSQINFSITGEPQTLNTEFFDGLSVTLSVMQKTPDETLEEFADRMSTKYEDVAPRESFSEAQVGGYPGFKTVNNGITRFTRYYLSLQGNNVLEIDYTSVGPEKSMYDNLVAQMLASLNLTNSAYSTPQTPEEGTFICTMDAKICPDGSTVGRQGPNCEFAACPGE